MQLSFSESVQTLGVGTVRQFAKGGCVPPLLSTPHRLRRIKQTAVGHSDNQ